MNISQILKTKTISHISISTFGTLLNGILGALFFIILAKALGPSDFGLFAVAIATLTLISDIADSGINTGLINFISRHLSSNTDQAYRFLKLGLEIKIIIWLIILPIGWLLAPFLCQTIFQKQELINPIRVMMIGVGGALLFSFATNALQALQKFWAWSFLNILSNGLRLILIGYLVLIGRLSLPNVLWVYVGILFLGFFIGLKFLPLRFLKVTNEKSVGREFFHYNKWIALFTILAALSSRLDTFLTARLVTTAQLGIYSVAVQLSSAVPQLVFAIAAAIAPKLASFTTDQQAKSYLMKLQLLVIGIALLGTVSFPIAYYFFPWLGPVYQASIMPFIILMVAQLIFLIAIPTHQVIFYYFQKPNFFFKVSLIRFFLTLGAGYFLILNYGIIGAALAVLIGSLSDFILPAVWVIYRFNRRK